MQRRTSGWSITMLMTPIVLAACVSTPTTPATDTTTTAVTNTTAVAPPAPTPAVRTVNWFDLDVGQCLANPPPIDDPNVIAVAVVDCSMPHQAEVFRRAPLAVNTAIAAVAERKCDDGFTAYTGEPIDSGTFTVTYLIDSNQNRTSSNPDPSTVICLLQAAGGGPLTVPARR